MREVLQLKEMVISVARVERDARIVLSLDFGDGNSINVGLTRSQARVLLDELEREWVLSYESRSEVIS